MKLVLAVTCYNRLDLLKEFILSWNKTKNENFDWTLIIADDGSCLKQINYIDELKFDKKIVIKNKRRGISHQTNCIFNELKHMSYDICFKCDEDIIFAKKGWDDIYADVISNTSYKHLCHDNPRFNHGKWCEGSVLKNPEIRTVNGKNLIAYVKNTHVKGCFYTVTPEIQEKIGYMDVINFFHGYEHIDFSMRCARAGFNDEDLGFDIQNSDQYIQYRFNNTPSLCKKELIINGSGIFSNQIKKSKILEKDRLFIPYLETEKRMKEEILQ